MNTPTATRILIVDDEAAQMRALCDTLRDQGYEAEGFTSGEAALEALQARPFDLLLTDLMMPGMDGVALLAAALKTDPNLVGILMTGMGTIETAVKAMQAGALDYILKPFKLSTVLPVLARASGVRRLRMENMHLRDAVAIHELNQAIANTLDPDVLLDKIAGVALAQFDADEASIMLATEDGTELRIAAVRGKGRESLLGTRVPVGEGVCGWVAASREPLVLEGEVRPPQPLPLHPRADILSALSIPMIARNKLIGILNVSCTRRRGAFASGQVRLMGIFTNAAAAGIEAARIHEEQRKADRRYREVLDMAADAIISLDDHQRIVVFNAGAEAMFGYRAEEVAGHPLDLLLPAGVAEVHRRHVQAFGQGEEGARAMAGREQLLGRRKDGTQFRVEAGISRRTEGGATIYTAVVRDITLRVQQEARIARLTQLYAVLSGINSAIVRIDDEGELYAEICRIAVELGKFTCAWVATFDSVAREIELVAGADGSAAGTRFRVDPAEPGGQGLLAQAVLENRMVWDNDLAARAGVGYLRRDFPGARAGAALPFVLEGSVAAVMLLYADTPGAFGDEELRLLRELAGDVSFALDHIAKTRRVDYLATHDQLTGLPNRMMFMDRLAQAVAAAKQKETHLAVVLADIERFSSVNDTFGRQGGDDLLRRVAQRLQSTAGDNASLARIGADAFAAINPDVSQPTVFAKTVGRRIESLLSVPFEIEGKQLHLSARAGVAFFPADGDDAGTLINNAEAALKRAKGQHEQVVFYTPDLNSRVAEQLTLEGKLRRALEQGQFVLHYQPKVELESGRIAGLEALIRWQDPDTGLVPPLRFIPLLEETGLILQVGRWAMEEAVRMVTSLRAQGLPPVRIAVNVSPLQLRAADFVRSVEKAISAGSDAAHGLDLEITESVIMHDIEANVSKLNDLSSMNVELSIDDFGTGYSSLAYFARLPVGVIKVDRAFIRDITKNADNLAIVQAIISMTQSLKRKVVAEGVETGDQARILRLLRCNQYQGYFFSKPVAAPEVATLLRTAG